MGLSSFRFVWWAPQHTFIMQNSALTVIEGIQRN